MQRFIVLALFLSFGINVFSQTNNREEAILGKAGSEFVTEHEFLDRFELTPGLYRHRLSQLDEEKLLFLYSMVAEKLLSQEAVKLHFDRDTVYQRAIYHISALLARDELYRREISGNVSIGRKELQESVKKALNRLLVSYLFFPSHDDAQFIRSRIKNKNDFQSLTIDSSVQYLRDTATIVWGDADTAIEYAAYRLSPEGVSPVISAGDGYYILTLVRSQPNEFYTKMQPSVLGERVEKILRQRKEEWQTEKYLDELMKHKTSYSPPIIFQQFSVACESVEVHKRLQDSLFNRDDFHALTNLLHDKLDDTLIVAGSAIWTVKDAILKLLEKSFLFTRSNVHAVSRRLYNEFHQWTWLELLEQEAIARGLDRTPDVQRELEPWRTQILAQMLKEYMNSRVTVSDQEVISFMKSSDSGFVLPQVKILSFHTPSLDGMKEALAAMENGISLKNFLDQHSSGALFPKAVDTTFFPITEHSPLGEIAWQMDIGQQFGPVSDSSGGYIYFELLDKKGVTIKSDTAFASQMKHAHDELLRMKRKRKLDLFLSQIAKQQGVAVYQDRLQRLSVTPVPMMTYRLLGFGGRMFAEPFVDKQIDWLSIEPPTEAIVP